MSEPTFREKYEWWLASVPKPTDPAANDPTGWNPDVIERLYAEAHPPKVTAEDVFRRGHLQTRGWAWQDAKWGRSATPYEDAAGLRDGTIFGWRAVAIHLAHVIADLENERAQGGGK